MAIEQKIGTTVKLVSGGPSMTIIKVDSGEVQCSWFNANGELQTAWYPVETLMLAPKVGDA